MYIAWWDRQRRGVGQWGDWSLELGAFNMTATPIISWATGAPRGCDGEPDSIKSARCRQWGPTDGENVVGALRVAALHVRFVAQATPRSLTPRVVLR